MDIKTSVDNVQCYIKQEKPKAQGIIGNITIYFSKPFNWIQRKMWQVCFGLEITNIKE